MMIGKYYWVC